jgi:hypothetical protein
MGSTLFGEAAEDCFAISVAISSIGLPLAVGADWYDGAAGEDAGLIHIFQSVENDWEQIGRDLEGGAEGDSFGTSVALSADGTVVGGIGYEYVQIFSQKPNDS